MQLSRVVNIGAEVEVEGGAAAGATAGAVGVAAALAATAAAAAVAAVEAVAQVVGAAAGAEQQAAAPHQHLARHPPPGSKATGVGAAGHPLAEQQARAGSPNGGVSLVMTGHEAPLTTPALMQPTAKQRWTG